MPDSRTASSSGSSITAPAATPSASAAAASTSERTDSRRWTTQAAVASVTSAALSGWPPSHASPNTPASTAALRSVPRRQTPSAATNSHGSSAYAFTCGCISQSTR